jgi:UDPglucose--hexose-1-phosphate uridylyltransferase
MPSREWQTHPHRRLNPLTGEWVLISPHRADRPWLGERSTAPPHAPTPAYDPTCYLCPGNERANGAHNPHYESIFVFDNDFPALTPDGPEASMDDAGLAVAQSERGVCRVICFSPRHDLHLANMPLGAVREVVDCWAGQYAELAARPEIASVSTFENRGAMMGASNPHPHGQLWAESRVPNELRKETAQLRAYAAERNACLLCAYVAYERNAGDRIVADMGDVIAVVPFWAVWPFELLVLPVGHRSTLPSMESNERDALARTIADILKRYDGLFGVPFPYSMGFHQQPCDDAEDYSAWHAHAHYYPPLLRSADVRKYMVGYEMLAQPQRDRTPEQAAQLLRDA